MPCLGVQVECLKRRSLLESFDMSDDSFRMHDLWREFAANEVEGGQGKARHLLYKNEKCSGRVDMTEFPTIKVVKLRADETKDVAVDVRGLKHLKSLELFGHRGGALVKVNELGTLENLTYLRWWDAASSACIAELGRLTNLQVVDLGAFTNPGSFRLLLTAKYQSTESHKFDALGSFSMHQFGKRGVGGFRG
jgi:hypothetical protein